MGFNMFKKLLFKINDKLTRKNFTHVNSDGTIYFTVAAPEDFWRDAAKNGYNVFSMACLQSYIQLDNGRWYAGLIFHYETNSKMKKCGISIIE